MTALKRALQTLAPRLGALASQPAAELSQAASQAGAAADATGRVAASKLSPLQARPPRFGGAVAGPAWAMGSMLRSALPGRSASTLTATPARLAQQTIATAKKDIDAALRTGNLSLVDKAGHALSPLVTDRTLDPGIRLEAASQLNVANAFGIDARELMAHVTTGTATLPDLMRKFDMSEHQIEALSKPPESLAGQIHLTPNECLALSLYSVRERGMETGSQVFRAVNTAMLAQLPKTRQQLDFIIAPLQSGMAKLPPLDGQKMSRGLQIGGMSDAELVRAHGKAFQPGSQVTMNAMQSGSRMGPYPGNVILRMKAAASGSALRDTSAFNYEGESQNEAGFLPGATFKVEHAATQKVQPSWTENDHRIASSGRAWANHVGAEVLVIDLQEVAARSGSAPSTANDSGNNGGKVGGNESGNNAGDDAARRPARRTADVPRPAARRPAERTPNEPTQTGQRPTERNSP